MKLLQDRVAVQRDEVVKQSPGGIVLPDLNAEKPLSGTVIEAGPGRSTDDGTLLPMTVKKGDRVLIGKFSGIELEYRGDDLVIIRESDILAVIE